MLGIYPLFPVPIAKTQYEPKKHVEFKKTVLDFIKNIKYEDLKESDKKLFENE